MLTAIKNLKVFWQYVWFCFTILLVRFFSDVPLIFFSLPLLCVISAFSAFTRCLLILHHFWCPFFLPSYPFFLCSVSIFSGLFVHLHFCNDSLFCFWSFDSAFWMQNLKGDFNLFWHHAVKSNEAWVHQIENIFLLPEFLSKHIFIIQIPSFAKI